LLGTCIPPGGILSGTGTAQWRIAMANILIRAYDNFLNAENARKELLGAGFAADHVRLIARDDEAGSVKGNFTVGNAPSMRDGISGVFPSSSSPNDSFDQTYARDYANAAQRGSYLLMVDAYDDHQQALASDIMQRFGAIDVDDRTSGRIGG
jgi:hypothetical protein